MDLKLHHSKLVAGCVVLGVSSSGVKRWPAVSWCLKAQKTKNMATEVVMGSLNVFVAYGSVSIRNVTRNAE